MPTISSPLSVWDQAGCTITHQVAYPVAMKTDKLETTVAKEMVRHNSDSCNFWLTGAVAGLHLQMKPAELME